MRALSSGPMPSPRTSSVQSLESASDPLTEPTGGPMAERHGRVADERDRVADQREARLHGVGGALDERARNMRGGIASLLLSAEETISRARDALARSSRRLDRADAALGQGRVREKANRTRSTERSDRAQSHGRLTQAMAPNTDEERWSQRNTETVLRTAELTEAMDDHEGRCVGHLESPAPRGNGVRRIALVARGRHAEREHRRLAALFRRGLRRGIGPDLGSGR